MAESREIHPIASAVSGVSTFSSYFSTPLGHLAMLSIFESYIFCFLNYLSSTIFHAVLQRSM